jgi:GDP-D-mannose dehydratase
MQEVIQIMQERNERGTVMVTGVIGQQGGAVAQHLLETGFGVRALVRDLQKPRIRMLAELGLFDKVLVVYSGQRAVRRTSGRIVRNYAPHWQA